MASKGPRSKLDHETRARRQKALEAPREPPRPKAHWDHVLEEMIWLSKDFESERKWKLAQAKKVAFRISKSVLEHATRGEKKVKEEEQRMRKIALNISKDVKKFWTKIEKLVLYKHQLELEERKKKALDKQLDFLLGQTERYSTMLAENLVDVPYSSKTVQVNSEIKQPCVLNDEGDKRLLIGCTQDPAIQLGRMETDDYFGIQSKGDEHIIEDEAQATEEPPENHIKSKVSREASPKSDEDVSEHILKKEDDMTEPINKKEHHFNGSEGHYSLGRMIDSKQTDNDTNHQYHREANGDFFCTGGNLSVKTPETILKLKDSTMPDEEYLPFSSLDELDDRDYDIFEEEKDDETTLSDEEALANKETTDHLDEIKLLQQESEVPVEELLARYKKDGYTDDSGTESESTSSSSDDQVDCGASQDCALKDVKSSEVEQPCTITEEPEANCDTMENGRDSEDIIADAAAAARSAQPTGNTLSTTKVRTKVPFLLKYPLREYQHIGLDWLVTMYEKRLNGILADEMGLGKTIMTIALLALLACEKGIWGPHLIVVPTSVMLNWETEFLKWCPAFKILTYFGSAKERKHKRQGWLKPNSFHICITTYRLVIQDSKVFKRKKWKYLILDEAHLIKNWKSQRWQTLLNFNSTRRILLTGTPLQNDLMELWSLMHFLMPHVFQSHQEFKDWFCNPISGMVEGQEKVNKEVVDRLHNVLRPFILRRLKRDVEKQLPKKFEHVVYCRLSKRQRNLYEDFIANSETQATLASANYFGMISVIMQLRKVCNHPDLFEGRPIISSFDMTGIDMQVSSSVCTLLSSGPFSGVDLRGLNLVFTQHEFNMTSWEADEIAAITSPSSIDKKNGTSNEGFVHCSRNDQRRRTHGTNIFEEIQKALLEEREKQSRERASSISWWNSIRCQKKPVYGTNMRELLTIKHPVFHIHEQKDNPSCYMDFSSKIADVVLSPVERLHKILDLVECFMFAIPASRAPAPVCWCNEGKSTVLFQEDYKEKCTEFLAPLLSPVRPAIVRRQVYFPDRRLIQFDCGKLQELATLLRRLKSEGHRALIFTQMTKMLDILEAFINLYGYTYMRLDGSTPPEERQTLMQRFNTNPKFFLFILSTRSGGVGINLVGADTVIFYDSDWNPAMDLQAQDRCHRIGQTREVHIYRLISESTIEENILKKANQKRILDDLVIQSGSYTTEFFKKLDPIELFSGHGALPIENLRKGRSTAVESCKATGMLPSNADVEAAIKDAEDEADYMALKRVEEEEAVDNQEFTEEATGRLDDDDLANEEETKADEKNAEKLMSLDNGVDLSGHDVNEEKALALSVGGEDIDMLADVKQLAAAAAAAGQASSSFENRLRPIDRYAMCFLDLWDPVIDKAAIEFQADVEEEEWELDRIEKLKEDMEAEIDEDQEPLLYESWDADFATMAYRQQVEALAQKQLLEDLENDAHEANNIEDDSWETNRNEASVERKVKSKKKSKKTKFKSLKKRSIASQLEVIPEELSIDLMSDDDPVLSPVVVHGESPPHLLPRKKRKKVIAIPEEENSGKSLKRLKRAHDNYTSVASSSYVKQVPESKGFKLGEATDDSDVKLARKSKTGGKISITVMPIKRVMVVKPERLKKRGNVWSKDCFPPPDVWFPQEDALLCAVVHEYGTDWGLVSDVLHDFPGGGFYRGRFRHPVHCCERFRELFYKYVLSAVDCSTSSTEKVAPSGSGKALLKVTEDHVRTLLKVTSERPDNELLLQKHFMAVISSVWRSKCRLQHHKNTPRNGFYSSRVLHAYRERPTKLTESTNLVSLRQSSKAVWNALNDANTAQGKEPMVIENQLETRAITEQLEEVTLHLHMDHADYGPALPPAISVSIRSPEPPPPPQPKGTLRRALLAESSCRIAENRFRAASEACFEGEGLGWATSAFPIYDFRHRSGSTGKHKASWDLSKPPKSKVPRTSDLVDDPGVFNPLLPLSRQTPTDLVEWSNFPYFILEYGDDGDCSQDPDMNFLLQETPCIEFAPDEHDLFYSELKDLGTLEIIDFG